MAETGPMVEASIEHWRRAVMCTFVGIFAASVLGGLVGGLTGGGALAAPAHAPAQVERTATAPRRRRRRRARVGPAVRRPGRAPC